MPLKVNVVAGFNYAITSFEGTGPSYFRVDDKKSLDRIKENSKFMMIKISVHQLVVILVGPKFNKYQVVINEYMNEEKWAKAIRSWFYKKIVREVTETEFLSTYNQYIEKMIKGGE